MEIAKQIQNFIENNTNKLQTNSHAAFLHELRCTLPFFMVGPFSVHFSLPLTHFDPLDNCVVESKTIVYHKY